MKSKTSGTVGNLLFFFFKQKTAYEMRISDWSSDVCSSDLHLRTLMDVPAEQITAELVEARARKVYFIPEGVPLPQQLVEFQRMKRRFAMVVDEYGEVIGMVTMADIREEIVGE